MNVFQKLFGKYFISPAELDAMGVIGLNKRNGKYLLPNNRRRLYRLVDDKLESKKLALDAGINTPELYKVIESPQQLKHLAAILDKHEDFVIKPVKGSGGKGIVVVIGRKRGDFLKPSGATVTLDEMKWHITNILGGLYSLGGQRDKAMIEYRVQPDGMFSSISYLGVPDIRVVLFHGYPVMAMIRLATSESDGRANLHQGAVGAGIDLASGRSINAVCHGVHVDKHPDTEFPLDEIVIPNWQQLLHLATSCYDCTGLGYMGVDMMVDEKKGPLLIELNARPGLAIQIANGQGLRHRLDTIAAQVSEHPDLPVDERIAFSLKHFSRHGDAIVS